MPERMLWHHLKRWPTSGTRSKPTRPRRFRKAYEASLFWHPPGRWCEKIKGRHHYFGSDPADWRRALQRYEREPPHLFAQDSVANIDALCRQRGVAQVDAIVCGLPWAAFSDRDQTEYLNAIMRVLKPGGHFATFAYLQGMVLPSARRFRKKLRKHFRDVRISRTVWLNVPPAFVYRCRR